MSSTLEFGAKFLMVTTIWTQEAEVQYGVLKGAPGATARVGGGWVAVVADALAETDPGDRELSDTVTVTLSVPPNPTASAPLHDPAPTMS
jgi:hypothetical protein